MTRPPASAMGKPPSTRVMEIFSEAAAATPDHRAAYLRDACGGDAELRAEVESLLATQDRLGAFLGAPEIRAEPGDDDPAPRDADSIRHGHALVGRYVAIERIGEGGCGVVYRARQSHPVRREVALKIVRKGMDTRQVVARFELERQTLALMDHPNIARVFDAGETADGRPYFAMELVRGPSITEYCDEHHLPIARRLEMFTAVCQAVQHAHQKGVIHRDLKPSNVLIVEIDGKPTPKVIDFGISQAARLKTEGGVEATGFVGTPQYMSPEQAADATTVDTRSDIYALGVMLHELLIGVTPLDDDRVQSATYAEIQAIIRNEKAIGLSLRLATMPTNAADDIAERRGVTAVKLRRMVTGELDWIVAKALEKDPRRRYQTVAGLGEDVRRHLTHEPLLSGPSDALYRARKFARRHAGPLSAVLLIVLAVVLGLAGTTFGLIRARHNHARAEAALMQAERIGAFLSDMLRSADPDRSRGEEVRVRDVLDGAARSIDEGALHDQPLVEAGIRSTLGAAYESLGLYAESLPQHRRAYEIRLRELGRENRDTARSMSVLAWALELRAQDGDAALALAAEAETTLERLLGPRHPDSIAALIRHGMMLRNRRQPDKAEAILRRVVVLARSVPASRAQLATVNTNLGVLLMDRGDNDGAEPLLKEALVIDRELHGDRFRNVPRNLSNLAAIRQARGDLAGAEAEWLEALRLQRDILPSAHPDIAWTLRLLGRVKHAQGDQPAAERYLKDAIEMERQVFGPRHPLVAMFLTELATVEQANGRRADAAAARRESIDIRLAIARAALASKPGDAERRRVVGEWLARRGDWDEAKRLLNEAADGDFNAWMAAAALDRWLGDDAAYEAIRRRILDHPEALKEAEALDAAAIVCLMADAAPADAAAVAALVERAAAASNAGDAKLYRGVAMCRAGRYAEAEPLLMSTRTEETDPDDRSIAGFALAAALSRQGRGVEAAAAFADAVKEYNKLPTLNDDGDLGEDFAYTLAAQVARRDAEAVMRP